jgi:hypothetical protein
MMGDDATVERMAREEQEKLARAHGQHILDAAVMQDTARGAQDADPARAHGEWLLGRLADDDGQRGEIMDLMNRAWRQAAEENRNDY